MPYCCAVGCTNGEGSGKSFFTFPKDEKRRKVWKIRVKREGWEPSKRSVLCSDHFENSMFTYNPGLAKSLGVSFGQMRLKSDAVPTIFSHTKVPAERKSVLKKKRRYEVRFT